MIALWPHLIAYALSFGVIGIMWQNHHALFRRVEGVDRTTVFWNLFLLGGTAFIPFATNTLGSYPTMSASAFLYGLTLSTTATCYNLMLSHLVRTRAFHPRVSDATIAATVRAYRTVGGLRSGNPFGLGISSRQLRSVYLMAVYYLVPRGVDSDTA